MKYLPIDLAREYEFFNKTYPDKNEYSAPLINLSDIFRAYFILVHYFTDDSSNDTAERMLVGIRSVPLLESALNRQVVSYNGKFKYTADLDICATLFFGLVKDHAFSDGNKRTALLILLYQLQLYGYYPTASKKDFEKLVISLAEGSIQDKYSKYYKKFKKNDDPIIRTISYCLKRMTAKKNHSYNISPTMREFCSALENRGVKYQLQNGKMQLTYTASRTLFMRPKKISHTIPFGGWSRTVGAKTARETLKALNIYDEFASYQDLLAGKEPMYALVDDFKEPLRRLKDK